MLKIFKCSTGKYLKGEALSSWCYRLCQFPEVQQHLMEHFWKGSNQCPLFLSLFEFDQHLETGSDLDFVSPNQLGAVLKSVIGNDLEKFSKPTGHVSPIIPWVYRRSYCQSCMVEAMRYTRAPILKCVWRQVLEPFCAVHNTLLWDAPRHVSDALDAPRAIFKWHHSVQARELRYEDYVNDWSCLLQAACRVQKKFVKLRKSQGAGGAYLIDNTLMCLMRVLLTPGTVLYGHAGSRRLLDIKSTEGETLYVSCYLQPFRASAACRARALFFIGVLIGWIGRREATASLKNDYWAPSTPDQVWRSVYEFDPKIFSWLCENLRRFETRALLIPSSNIV
ncbi:MULTISPECIES: hypothetical protein [Pseudomonas]|uniref:hypothetical protein n=1 Tax=Pseudomonas TaxID=286 RepID=UPI000FBC3C26|nr:MULTISPECIES: hypothetical protein [Pseudomonas]MDD1977596.1 hypothetical protein [Pseudomonas putida]